MPLDIETLGTYLTDNRQYVRKVASDLLAIIPLGVAVLVLYLAGQPYHRGFNCDDESIRYPYKDNTITSTTLYFYSTTIPLITIIIVEFFHHKKNVKKFIETDGLSTGRPSYLDYLWQIYLRLSPFVFGALVSQMTTDIAKYSIGRLRPHFIDICRPRLNDGLIITRVSSCANIGDVRYIEDYACSNQQFTDDRKRDAHLSFMSGHSSFSAFCLIYLVIYLQLRVKWTAIGFLRPLYQSLLIYLVLFTGFSRISDYKHHWSDVFIGLIQGTVVAILITHYVSDLYVKNEQPPTASISLGLNESTGNNGANGTKRNPNYNSCSVEVQESIGA